MFNRSQAPKRITGKVEFFSDIQGYGFVKSGKNEYFVHSSSILDSSHLKPGDEIEFVAKETQKGPVAIEVKVISRNAREEELREKEKWIFMKKNPFTPQDPIVDPARFAGRRSHIANAIDAIYNSKNILITGPRGIGKSSIAYQLMYLANGDSTLAERLDIDLGGINFNYAIGDHRCSPGNNLASVSTSLITTLAANLGEKYREVEKQTKLELGLKYFKLGESHKYEKYSAGDLAGMFAVDVEFLLKSVDQKFSGVTFLIDEIDTLENDVDLASFLKAVIEKFRLNHHLSISFIVSGVTGTVTKLVMQHPSAGRLFENISIGAMSSDELGEIIDLSLDDTGVDISDAAKFRIVDIANYFPQPVQLIGYHAFKLDSNASICVDDVDAAKNFIVQHVRQQEFQERFGEVLQGQVKSVARAFAISMYETTGLSYLKKHSKSMKEGEILSCVSLLVAKDILEEIEINTWKFRDPLFRVYFRMVLGIDDSKAAKERGASSSRPRRRPPRRGNEKLPRGRNRN